ncbi:MAG: leucine-rich repeat protein, partial [Clostridia bacterium]|nr:leucine-rich repeat protein [Clostridia bacterium]
YINGIPVTAISSSAFRNQDKIYSITIPASVTSIASGAFVGCSNLGEIKVDPANTKYAVNNKALTNADGSILYICLANSSTYVLSEGVTTIKSGAFDGSLIKYLVFNTTLQNIEVGAFDGADYLVGFENVTANAYFTFEKGALFYKEKTVLYKYLSKYNSAELTIPSSVVEICDEAFANAENLKQLVVSSDLTVGNDVFKNTDIIIYSTTSDVYNLEYACVHEGVELRYTLGFDYYLIQVDETLKEAVVMGLDANKYNAVDENGKSLTPALRYLYVPMYINGYKVVGIGDGAFAGALYDNFKGYYIPDTVQYLGENAFADTKAEGIVLGTSLSEIGEDAFSSQSIKELYIKGNAEFEGENLDSILNATHLSYLDIPYQSTEEVTAFTVSGSINMSQIGFVRDSTYYLKVKNSLLDGVKEIIFEMTYGEGQLYRVLADVADGIVYDIDTDGNKLNEGVGMGVYEEGVTIPLTKSTIVNGFTALSATANVAVASALDGRLRLHSAFFRAFAEGSYSQAIKVSHGQ